MRIFRMGAFVLGESQQRDLIARDHSDLARFSAPALSTHLKCKAAIAPWRPRRSTVLYVVPIARTFNQGVVLLRLPKDIQAHPRLDDLTAYFTNNTHLLRADGGRVKVSMWPFNDAMRQALQRTYLDRQLHQGLESIAETLDCEQKGLKMAQQKAAQAPEPRLARLLLLSRDGSPRFYREAEQILERHGERTWGVMLDVDAAELGASFTAKGQAAKALMIGDRRALGRFLTIIADSLPTS